MERRLAMGDLRVLYAEAAPSGISAPLKLTVEVAGEDEPASIVQVKWKRVPPGGDKLNNSPRRELAAYAFQKLLFDEADWVVPPTTLRGFARGEVADHHAYENSEQVLALVSYWQQGVTTDSVLDRERWQREPEGRRVRTDVGFGW
ncbi:MAG: hypothetical protein AAGA56_05830 [Myxococcota bacterium]